MSHHTLVNARGRVEAARLRLEEAHTNMVAKVAAADADPYNRAASDQAIYAQGRWGAYHDEHLRLCKERDLIAIFDNDK